MNEREMDQIATLVAEKLGGATHDGARHASPVHHASPQPAVPAPVSASRSPLPGDSPSCRRVADFVDHTLLKAEATQAEIEKLCEEAAEHHFAAVCVNGSWVELCADLLTGTDVHVATVVGFPLGAVTSKAKAFETGELVACGAREIDMVAAIGRVVTEDWDYVEDDIRAVVTAAAGCTVKVIIESAALEPLQAVKVSAIAMEAGAHYVKTSTGFHPSGGATAEAVALMRLAVGDRLGVKASGGVRDCATALRMIAAGATRIGTSSGVQFVKCIGAGPIALDDMLADPDRHDRVCMSH